MWLSGEKEEDNIMKEVNLPELIEYLVKEDDFVKAASGIFDKCSDYLGIDELCLMQISPDKENVTVIACSDGGGSVLGAVGNSKALTDMPWLGNTVCETAMDNGGYGIYIPVFLGEKAAMYVCSYNPDGSFSKEQVKLLTQAALILQNIALRKNFEDSLENSYRLLCNILDHVPAGIAVLDKENSDILLMNRTVMNSEAMQNAVGFVLANYDIECEIKFKDICDAESGRWFDLDFIYIDWIHGESVLMCSVLDVTDKVRDKQKAEYQANNDYLTGLFNRMKCERDLKYAIRETIKNETKGVLIYLDLDDFKQINDNFGHQYGDVLLQGIAAELQAIEPITHNCYRLGGDEFVIILRPEAFDKTDEVISQISRIFTKEWNLIGIKYNCTMSMGAAIFPDDGSHTKEIMQNADYAMYKAKKNGKNCFLWYKDSIDEKMADRKYMVEELVNSLDYGFRGFVLRYYGIRNLEGDRVYTGSRLFFRNRNCGTLNSSQFMDIAEYRGLSGRISDYQMENITKLAGSLRIFSDIRSRFIAEIPPMNLMSEKYAERLTARVKKNRAEPEDIVLCISDTLEFRDEKKVADNVKHLREQGYRIAISDFAKGSMSLEHIVRYGAELVIVGEPKGKEERDSLKGVIEALKSFSEIYRFNICVGNKLILMNN